MVTFILVSALIIVTVMIKTLTIYIRDIDEENEPYDSDVLRLRGGSVSLTPNASIPIGLVSNCNRYLHPQLWTDEEIKSKIRITKDAFLNEFCPPLHCATQSERHQHEAKCFLYLVKMASNPSWDSLAADFMIDKKTARSWFMDISFAMFLTCPYLPTLFNDAHTTNAELDSFFTSVNTNQSAYVKHIVSAFRSADGRPVTLLNNDYTSLLMTGMSTEDFVKAQDFHSGMRGDKWTIYVSALVDGNGKVVAIPSGAGIGKSPRGGTVLLTQRY